MLVSIFLNTRHNICEYNVMITHVTIYFGWFCCAFQFEFIPGYTENEGKKLHWPEPMQLCWPICTYLLMRLYTVSDVDPVVVLTPLCISLRLFAISSLICKVTNPRTIIIALFNYLNVHNKIMLYFHLYSATNHCLDDVRSCLTHAKPFVNPHTLNHSFIPE
jgi:hypothetical protein